MSASRQWKLVLEGERPWTVNGERKLHPHQRAERVRRWREHAAMLARAERIPRLDAVRVSARPMVKNRRAMQDTGGCFPAVKAAIDGLVDAGVLDDDGPDVVVEITFRGPALGGLDGLLLVVEEVA